MPDLDWIISDLQLESSEGHLLAVATVKSAFDIAGHRAQDFYE